MCYYVLSGMAAIYTSQGVSTGTRTSMNFLSGVTRTSDVQCWPTKEILLGWCKDTRYTAFAPIIRGRGDKIKDTLRC